VDALTIVLFIAGLVVLVVGANLLIGGATALAGAIGISPLIVGLTIVAFGTNAPELAVSIQSSYADQDGVGVGNVVGSAIFNVLFILGLSALVAPLVVSRQLLRRDGPVMIVAALLLFALAFDNGLSRRDGFVLLATLGIYLAILTLRARSDRDDTEAERETTGPWFLHIGRIALGLFLLVLGADWLVDGAVELAETLGLSTVVVGLTVVAAGTGLPEVAATLLATLRGERDLAVGNVVGSNIFNILAVLGLAALVGSGGIAVPPSASTFHIPVFIVVAFVSVLAFTTECEVDRWEGGLLFAGYVTYTIFLILEASDHRATGPFQILALTIIAVALGLLVARAGLLRRVAARFSPNRAPGNQ
jgi:cation:H+ antiporter